MPSPNGGDATPRVDPLLSIPLNELQLDNPGLGPQPATFASAADFAFYLYHLLEEWYKIPAEGL